MGPLSEDPGSFSRAFSRVGRFKYMVVKLRAIYEEESRFPDGVYQPYSGSGLEGTYQEPWNKIASKGPSGDEKFAGVGHVESGTSFDDLGDLLEVFKERVVKHVPELDPAMKLVIHRMADDFNVIVELVEFITDRIGKLFKADVEIDDPEIRKLVAIRNYAYDAALAANPEDDL